MSRGTITWLASYPKSGNTWLRVFLANLMAHAAMPVDINDLQGYGIASNRQLFDENSGIASSDLKPGEIAALRPRVYENIAAEAVSAIHIKIHDAFTTTPLGVPMVGTIAHARALYIIRNPLDVAVSLAHHLSVSVEKAVDAMNNEQFAFCEKNNKLHNQLEQKLLSWSNHVQSWQNQTVLPVKIIRYEDMLHHSIATFTEAAAFAGIASTPDEILKAIEFSRFEKLKEQELNVGFKERAPGSDMFFRKGKTGTWKDELPQTFVDQIVKQHAATMIAYGYLDKNLNPL